MARFELQLRVDAPCDAPDGTSAMLSEESQALRGRVYGALRLKARSVAWVTITLGTPKGDGVVETLIDERRAGHLVVGAATLMEYLDQDEAARTGWFVVRTRQDSDSFSLWDDYPSCKAGTLPKVHALNHTFVSEAFVSACGRAKLTGVEFLRCRNKGRKPGRPWFAALPAGSLGNGIDHPWFDRRRWAEHVRDAPHKRASAVGDGRSSFHQYWLRPDVGQNQPLVARLLEMSPMPVHPGSGLDGLSFSMVERYSSEAAPPGDFAYLRWGEDGPNREGRMMRFRMLAASRRARDVLLREGLFRDKDFWPVRLVAPPSNQDAHGWQPQQVPPMYLDDELAVMRRREANL
jgi:hypothetical protein